MSALTDSLQSLPRERILVCRPYTCVNFSRCQSRSLPSFEDVLPVETDFDVIVDLFPFSDVEYVECREYSSFPKPK